jgi:DNA-binding HxlR family transcriptional regulator
MAKFGFIIFWHNGEMTRKEFNRAVGMRARTTIDRTLKQLREAGVLRERSHPEDGRKKLYWIPHSPGLDNDVQ